MMKPRWTCLFALVALAAVSAGAEPVATKPAAGGKSVHYYSRPNSSAPFSAAVRAGDTLYLSGMIGARADGTLPQGIEAQTRQAMDNLRQNLALAGADFSDVVHCTAMLQSMSDWPAFNRAYVSYFEPGHLPARSAFAANGLALGALVEIECQAHVRPELKQ